MEARTRRDYEKAEVRAEEPRRRVDDSGAGLEGERHRPSAVDEKVVVQTERRSSRLPLDDSRVVVRAEDQHQAQPAVERYSLARPSVGVGFVAGKAAVVAGTANLVTWAIQARSLAWSTSEMMHRLAATALVPVAQAARPGYRLCVRSTL